MFGCGVLDGDAEAKAFAAGAKAEAATRDESVVAPVTTEQTNTAPPAIKAPAAKPQKVKGTKGKASVPPSAPAPAPEAETQPEPASVPAPEVDLAL